MDVEHACRIYVKLGQGSSALPCSDNKCQRSGSRGREKDNACVDVHLDEGDEDRVKIAERCPSLHVETELLLKVSTKGHAGNEPTQQMGNHPLLVLQGQRAAADTNQFAIIIMNTAADTSQSVIIIMNTAVDTNWLVIITMNTVTDTSQLVIITMNTATDTSQFVINHNEQ